MLHYITHCTSPLLPVTLYIPTSLISPSKTTQFTVHPHFSLSHNTIHCTPPFLPLTQHHSLYTSISPCWCHTTPFTVNLHFSLLVSHTIHCTPPFLPAGVTQHHSLYTSISPSHTTPFTVHLHFSLLVSHNTIHCTPPFLPLTQHHSLYTSISPSHTTPFTVHPHISISSCHTPFNLHHPQSWQPFTRLKCSKIRFKRSNLILNAMYMVLLQFPRNMCQNRSLAWSAAERLRERCALQRNVWKTSLLELRRNAVKTASHNPQNGKSVYFLSLFLCWCDTSSWRVVRRCTVCHGRQESPKKQVLHFTYWVFCIYCRMHRNFSVNILFPENLVCIFLTRFISQELAFSFCFSIIWNDWKWKSFHRERMHKSRNWPKCYD